MCKCGSVLANDGGLEQSAHANGNWCRDVNVCLLWQSWTRESEVDSAMPSAAVVASRLPPAAVARVLAKAARAVETQTSAIVVDRSVIDDLIALVETRVAVSVASVDI